MPRMQLSIRFAISNGTKVEIYCNILANYGSWIYIQANSDESVEKCESVEKFHHIWRHVKIYKNWQNPLHVHFWSSGQAIQSRNTETLCLYASYLTILMNFCKSEDKRLFECISYDQSNM
jgi:hypothetical protein